MLDKKVIKSIKKVRQVSKCNLFQAIVDSVVQDLKSVKKLVK